MVKCSFCGKDIEKGKGKMFVKNDGKILYFCSSKCEKNMLKLRRKPRDQRWTEAHKKEKSAAKDSARSKTANK